MKSSTMFSPRPAFLLTACVSLCLLAGCSTVKTQAYNAWNNIKSLVVVERTSKESYGVDIVAHPGANFGMVGTLMATLDLSSKSSRLTEALDPKATALQQRLAERLARALRAEGYDSSVMQLNPEASSSASQSPMTQADAYITLDLQAQYIAAGPTSDYIPFVRVNIAQNDSRTGKVLYQDTLTYGYEHEDLRSIHLPCDTKYHFKDMTSLLADPSKAREGLQAGVDAIVAQIASDLQR